MAKYEIIGGQPLKGEVVISGAKNAVVAILPATLLVPGKCRIENVPNISDVRILLDIMRSMGADVRWAEPGVVEIDCANYCKPSGRVIGNNYYEKLISMLDGGVDDVWIAGAEDFTNKPHNDSYHKWTNNK